MNVPFIMVITKQLYLFIVVGTRETAFLSAILSAGIVEKVAQAKLARTWCDDARESAGSGTDIIYSVDDDSNIDYAIKFVEAFTDPKVTDDYKSIDTAVTSGGSISNGNVATTTTTISGGTLSGGKPDDSSGDGAISSGEINYFSSGDMYIYSNEPDIKLMESHNNRVGREVSYGTMYYFQFIYCACLF